MQKPTYLPGKIVQLRALLGLMTGYYINPVLTSGSSIALECDLIGYAQQHKDTLRHLLAESWMSLC